MFLLSRTFAVCHLYFARAYTYSRMRLNATALYVTYISGVRTSDGDRVKTRLVLYATYIFGVHTP